MIDSNVSYLDNSPEDQKLRALAAQAAFLFKEAHDLVSARPSLRESAPYRRLCGEAAKFATGFSAAARILLNTMEEPGRRELMDFEASFRDQQPKPTTKSKKK